ncbi:MAG TPA: hypothetical protein DCY88_22645 [Cyanobacteria bacterium UBA11372]|nr:hypothetical protein [Cyanobacteria bacterium UBA11372]
MAIAGAVCTVISIAVTETKPANAALIKYNFNVEILPIPNVPQPLLGSRGTGFFTYDNAAAPVVVPLGISYFAVNQLEFNFLGTTYTASDDVGVVSEIPGIRFPSVVLRNNVFEGLSYVVDSKTNTDVGFYFAPTGVNTSIFVAGRGAKAGREFTTSFLSSSLLSTGEGLSEGEVTYSLVQSVPEPGLVFGLSVLGLGFLLKKKLASFQKTKAKVSL